jgi:hypothetical protein
MWNYKIIGTTQEITKNYTDENEVFHANIKKRSVFVFVFFLNDHSSFSFYAYLYINLVFQNYYLIHCQNISNYFIWENTNQKTSLLGFLKLLYIAETII